MAQPRHGASQAPPVRPWFSDELIWGPSTRPRARRKLRLLPSPGWTRSPGDRTGTRAIDARDVQCPASPRLATGGSVGHPLCGCLRVRLAFEWADSVQQAGSPPDAGASPSPPRQREWGALSPLRPGAGPSPRVPGLPSGTNSRAPGPGDTDWSHALPPLCWVSGVQTDAALGPPRPPGHVSRAVVTNLRYAAWCVTHTLVHTHTRTHTHVSCWWLLWTALTGGLVAPFSPRKVRRSVSRPVGSGPWGGPTRASAWRRPGHSGPIFPVSLQACVSASPAVGPRWPAATRVPIQLRSQACGAPADPSEGPRCGQKVATLAFSPGCQCTSLASEPSPLPPPLPPSHQLPSCQLVPTLPGMQGWLPVPPGSAADPAKPPLRAPAPLLLRESLSSTLGIPSLPRVEVRGDHRGVTSVAVVRA